MSTNVRITPDTIAEYDLVLSVSQDAINKQLQMLYEHKLEDSFVPIASEVDGGSRAAVPKYAINHDWKIQVETYTDEDTQEIKVNKSTGIIGHIACPRITLDGSDEATIEVKFIEDATVPRSNKTLKDLRGDWDMDVATLTDPDSCLYFWDGSPPRMYLRKINLNGWKMTWKTKLRVADIEGHMSAMLKAHKDPNDPTYLPPGVENYMKTPDAKLFTVSSIFCLFQSTLFTNNFEVVDAAGMKPSDKTANSLMDHIERYYSGLQKKYNPAMPSPDNFVLGYGLTQDVQKIQDIDKTATWKDTPAYFIPATFDLTTTKANTGATGREASGNNTLNFCMVTHRSKGPDDHWRTIDPINNKNSGNLVIPFSERTQKFDGDAIMAWSREIFWKKWTLDYIKPTMSFDLIPMVESFVKQWTPTGKGPNEWGYDKRNNNPPQERPGYFSQNMDFDTQYIFVRENTSVPLHWEWLKLDGFNKFTIYTSSDLQRAIESQKKPPLASDAPRRVFVTIEVDMRLRMNQETSAAINGPVKPAKNRAYEATIAVRHRIVLCITAGSAGKWTVEADPSTQPRRIADLLNRPGNTVKEDFLQFQDLGWGGAIPDNGYGAWTRQEEHNNSHFFTNSGVIDKMKENARKQVSDEINNVMQRLDAVMNLAATSIMMPGGEVMTFSGMDTTGDDAQLYAHVRYALGANDVHQT